MHRFFPVFLVLKNPYILYFEGVGLAPVGIPCGSPRPPGKSSGKFPKGAPGCRWILSAPRAAPLHEASGQAEGLKDKQLSGQCLACFIRIIFPLVHLGKSRMRITALSSAARLLHTVVYGQLLFQRFPAHSGHLPMNQLWCVLSTVVLMNWHRQGMLLCSRCPPATARGSRPVTRSRT